MKRIYIADVIHEQLKKEAKAEGRTLQWVVESRLIRDTAGTPTQNTPLPKNMGASDLVKPIDNYKDVVVDTKKSGASPVPTPTVLRTPLNDGEFACCQNETHPCKHWVWDSATGEGYRNLLSGRFREAE